MPKGLKSGWRKPSWSRDETGAPGPPPARRPLTGATMMFRSIALAAILGAGIAAAAVYGLTRVVPRLDPAAWVGVSDRAVEPEAWPICTTMEAVADSADWAPLDPDFAAGKRALAGGDWNGAITALKLAALRDPRNADIQNYIGYAYRRLRLIEPAFQHYRQALAFNPRHRAAQEHIGEAYLAVGKLAEAEEHLAALERICLIPCGEYGDLKRAIAVYKNSAVNSASGLSR